MAIFIARSAVNFDDLAARDFDEATNPVATQIRYRYQFTPTAYTELSGNFDYRNGELYGGNISRVADWVDGRIRFEILGIAVPVYDFAVERSTDLFEDLFGGFDVIRGSRQADLLRGYGGGDLLRGGSGNDTIDGGADPVGVSVVDTADYSDARGGVAVRLGLNGAAGSSAGAAGRDELVNIDAVIGSGFDDVLLGNERANRLQGGAGDDRLDSANGFSSEPTSFSRFDTLEGQEGDDLYVVAQYGSFGSTVSSASVVEQADAGIDTVKIVQLPSTTPGTQFYNLSPNVENAFVAGRSPIVLGGNSLANELTGGNGGDQIFGQDGQDVLDGKAGRDVLNGGAGADRLEGGDGSDTFQFSRDAFGNVGSTVDRSGRDTILDFSRSEGDQIDLRALLPSFFGLDFIGSRGFSGRGEEVRAVRVESDENPYSLVLGDIDGDRSADFAVRVEGRVLLQEGDFVL